METVIIQRRQIAEKRETLSQLVTSVKTTEDLIFDLMKESTPITVYTEKNYNKLTEEDSKLREILCISDPKADLSEAFKNLVEKRMFEIQKRHSQAEELKQKFNKIKEDIKNTCVDFSKFKKSDTKKYIKGTLIKFHIDMKGLKDYIKQTKNNFKKYIEEEQKKFKEQYETLKNSELDKIKQMKEYNLTLSKKLDELKQERDRLLAELAAESSKKIEKPIQHKYDPEKKAQNFNNLFLTEKWKLQSINEKLRKFSYRKEMIVAINTKIDSIESRIDSLIIKIRKGQDIIQRNRQIEKNKRLARKQVEIRMNFLSLLRAGRLGMTLHKISAHIEPWSKAQNNLLKPLVNQIPDEMVEVEGKKISLSQLRKEIMMIEKENAEISYKNDMEIESIEREEDGFNRKTQELYAKKNVHP